jgi:folate-binding protein YgfZ
MNPNWQAFLGASGARIENGIVADFGDLAAELAAARDATVVSPLGHLGLLECAGDDAKTFLHNQFTSDINHLTSGSAQHSAWCTAKGRMLASFLLYRQGSDFRALLSADLLATIQKRLQMFVLRSRVKVADLSATHEFIGVSGPQSEAALQAAGLPVPAKLMETVDFSGGTVVRVEPSRFVSVASSAAATELWTKLAENARPAGTPAWRWLDIHAGTPQISAATTEAFVPQMVNFDKLGGVSFHKGCYPGQEVVARTQYLGKVKRHLYRIHAVNPILAGASIYAPENPDHPCGMVANSAPSPAGGYDALAVVQENFAEATGLGLDTPGGQGFAIEPLLV